MGVYDVVDVEECWRVTGRAPIAAKWIDTNKGSEASPKYRSRFVAREIKSLHGGNSREGLFAATPPWEAVKILLSDAVTSYGLGKPRKKLMFIEVENWRRTKLAICLLMNLATLMLCRR